MNLRAPAIVWFGIAIIALLTVSSSLFTVDQRERALLFYFGEIQGETYGPGLHLKKPFVETVKRFDARILTIDNQTENFLTVEKKNVEVDYYVKWRVVDPSVYYRATGGEELIATDRLSAIVNRGLRDAFGSRTVQQVVSGERNEIVHSLETQAASKVRDLGIEIIDVRVKRVDLPKDVSDSVYDRMRAERKRVASELRAQGGEQAEMIKAEADRDAEVLIANAYREAEKLRGEGDALAAEIFNKGYGQDPEFYQYYRSLNIYRDSFGGPQDMLVLEPNGELFKYFKQGADAR